MTPSRLRTCFTLAALLLVMFLVGLAVLGIIERHLEEHRHCPPFAVFDMESAQRDEGNRGREGQDVVHGCSVSQHGASRHVRSASP